MLEQAASHGRRTILISWLDDLRRLDGAKPCESAIESHLRVSVQIDALASERSLFVTQS